MDVLIGLIGSTTGLLLYWLGYTMGYRQGLKSGVIIQDLDPRIKHWWAKK